MVSITLWLRQLSSCVRLTTYWELPVASSSCAVTAVGWKFKLLPMSFKTLGAAEAEERAYCRTA